MKLELELERRMARIHAPERLMRRQATRPWGLLVIHILYTVWGYHTTSSANGQESCAPNSPLGGA